MKNTQFRKSLEETLEKKLSDTELSDNIISRIILICNKFELNLKEMGEIFNLVDKIVDEKIGQDEFIEDLFAKINTTKDEKIGVAKHLAEIIDEVEEIKKLKQELNSRK